MEANPMAFRGLMILPIFYRVLAKIRLRHMQSWAEAWMDPNTFSGAKGRGAQDAWYRTAAALEGCKLQGKP
eukprot:15147852-Alexandrium_andersonii.AAC.1